MDDKIYYVYGYFEPNATKPFYIGKGKGNRCDGHLQESNYYLNDHFHNKLRKMIEIGNYPIIKILLKNLSEKEAFKYEILLIKFYGRIDLGTGCLTNLTQGGEGRSGFKHTEETKIKLSISLIGREFNEDHKNKIAEALSGRALGKERRDKMRNTMRERHGKSIRLYSLITGETIKIFPSIRAAAKAGYSRSSIKDRLEKRHKCYGNISWDYV